MAHTVYEGMRPLHTRTTQKQNKSKSGHSKDDYLGEREENNVPSYDETRNKHVCPVLESW